nr:unnamed protein product [Callosobruchus analis]
MEVPPPPVQPVKRGLNAPVTRSTNVLAAVRKPPRDRGGGGQPQQTTTTPSLVPYLTRLSDVAPPQADASDGSIIGRHSLFIMILENPGSLTNRIINFLNICE